MVGTSRRRSCSRACDGRIVDGLVVVRMPSALQGSLPATIVVLDAGMSVPSGDPRGSSELRCSCTPVVIDGLTVVGLTAPSPDLELKLALTRLLCPLELALAPSEVESFVDRGFV